jgi:FtsH-binding integral membrane protein
MIWFWGFILFLVFFGSIWFGDRSLKSKFGLTLVVIFALFMAYSLQAERIYGCNELTQQGDC